MTNPNKTAEIAVRKAINNLPDRFNISQICEATGHSKNSVQCVLRRLRESGELVGVGKQGALIMYTKTRLFRDLPDKLSGVSEVAANRLQNAMQGWRDTWRTV